MEICIGFNILKILSEMLCDEIYDKLIDNNIQKVVRKLANSKKRSSKKENIKKRSSKKANSKRRSSKKKLKTNMQHTTPIIEIHKRLEKIRIIQWGVSASDL